MDAEIKIDKYGFEYYDKLPVGCRLANMDDFHVHGRKKLGLQFLIQWVTVPDYFEIRIMDESVTSLYLKPFIDDKRVFVKS